MKQKRAEPLETRDSYDDAADRRDFWDGRLKVSGMDRGRRIRIRKIQLSGNMITWGIYVEDAPGKKRGGGS